MYRKKINGAEMTKYEQCVLALEIFKLENTAQEIKRTNSDYEYIEKNCNRINKLIDYIKERM